MSQAWSYVQNGTTQGPVPEEALRAMLASGQLGPEDLVWRQGLPDWTKAGQLAELRPAPAPAPVPVPAAIPAPYPTPMPPPAMHNVYEAPRAAMLGDTDGSAMNAQAAVAGSLEYLRATKPWVRFLGVLGFISVGFTVLGALIVLGVSQAGLPGFAREIGFIIPLVYLAMAGLQLPPAIFLNRYASRIATLLEVQTPEALAEALKAQKSFWKFAGIFTLVMMILYAVGIVVAIAGAAIFSSGHRF